VPTDVPIGAYTFKCVPLSEASFTDISAVYVVLSVAPSGETIVLDVGHSGDSWRGIDGKDRVKCWYKHGSKGAIWVGVYPTPSIYTAYERLRVEGELRQTYQPPCGQP